MAAAESAVAAEATAAVAETAAAVDGESGVGQVDKWLYQSHVDQGMH